MTVQRLPPDLLNRLIEDFEEMEFASWNDAWQIPVCFWCEHMRLEGHKQGCEWHTIMRLVKAHDA